MVDDCIFCKIIAGDIPSSKVYEDEEVLAFLDISQVTPGHTLVVPKKHARNLLEMDKPYFTHMSTLSLAIPIKMSLPFHLLNTSLILNN